MTPIMLLNSHVTCSYIFYAYVLFLSTLNMCFFLFFLSLSLIDCIMAPKQCKSIPAQNPLQGSDSSSSSIPPVPFHIWFRDEKAKTDFFKKF